MKIKSGKYLLVIFLLMLGIEGYSQETEGLLNFGAKAGLNYTTIGTRYNDYVGSASPTLSMFFSYRVANSVKLFVEPGYSGLEFRQQQTDTKYQMDCIDLSLFSFLYPSSNSKDLALMVGLRPSFLISHNTLGFQNGSSTIMSDPANKNQNKQLDMGLLMGVSLRLSPIINLELAYVHSISDMNTMTNISGRPSTVEFGLRVNAIGFQYLQNSRQERLRQQIEKYRRGVLLVMLQTPSEAQIKNLKAEGSDNAVTIIENVYNTNNRIVMNEFKNEFTFCPVFFFYDDDAYHVVSKETKGIFLNKEFKTDTTQSIDTSGFFVASVCVDHSEYTQRMQLGLFVYGDDLKQLPKPFNPNLIDFMNDGNPLNYLNGKRMIIYNPSIVRKKVRKLNARLFKLAD